MAWVKQVNVRNLEFWNKKNLICFYESEKLKEEKEQKSVCKGGPFIRNGCSCIMLGTTMFTPEINMLCLVQADGVTVCPHAAIILYISWDFFYTTLQWMNFCWTFIFAFAKACWSFQQKMKEMVCPSLWCAILFYGTFFFFFHFYTFDIFCFKCICCRKCNASLHLTIVWPITTLKYGVIYSVIIHRCFTNTNVSACWNVCHR